MLETPGDKLLRRRDNEHTQRGTFDSGTGLFTKSDGLSGWFGNVINNTFTPPATKLSRKRLSGWMEG